MSIISSKKFKTHQTRILIVITGFIIILFSVLWSLWWLNTKNKLQNNISGNLNEIKSYLSEFHDFFQPTFTEILPMPVFQQKIKSDTLKNSNSSETEQFDSTYYFFLWDKFINDFGMNELDSMSIDSMIKVEMQKSMQNMQTETIAEDETFSLKKDELLFVSALKPLLSKSDNIKEQDSADFLLIEDNLFTLEFWKSPLNYQGIKTTGNLIIIYGISEFDSIVLYFISRNNFALKIKSKMYSLKNDGKFYPFKELQYTDK